MRVGLDEDRRTGRRVLLAVTSRDLSPGIAGADRPSFRRRLRRRRAVLRTVLDGLGGRSTATERLG
jgi:hypothetical protein